MAEQDWAVWKLLTDKIPRRCHLAATTSESPTSRLLQRGIKEGIGNSIRDQGEPDRLPQRDAGRGRYGGASWLYRP